jgi:putative NADH-flavin reductase
MKIVVFGASGRTGRQVVPQAVARGYEVTAFVRDASKQWFPDAVVVHQGDPSDEGSVEAALAGADAVISVLGPIAGETQSEISDDTATIAGVMERTGPHRVVLAANNPVFSDRDITGEFANVAAEHRRDLAILRGSALAWTVVAAPMLSDDPGSGSYDAVIDAHAPGGAIGRADLAAALLDALTNDDWIRHAVGVANAPPEEPTPPPEEDRAFLGREYSGRHGIDARPD